MPIEHRRISERLARHPNAHRLLRRVSKIGRYVLRRPHEPEFEAFRYLPKDGLFLDIGANVGQSAMSFRIFNRRARILSLEPNPGLEGDLRLVRRIVPRFDFMMVGAGSDVGTATLYVPRVERIAISGEASFYPELAADPWWGDEGLAPDALETVEARVIAVDGLFVDPTYVKIDAEGSAVEALEGMRRTILRCRPIFLIEGGQEEVDFLEPYGYRPFTYAGEGRMGPWNPAVATAFMLPT
jgi:FkbM family methyltransferase